VNAERQAERNSSVGTKVHRCRGERVQSIERCRKYKKKTSGIQKKIQARERKNLKNAAGGKIAEKTVQQRLAGAAVRIPERQCGSGRNPVRNEQAQPGKETNEQVHERVIKKIREKRAAGRNAEKDLRQKGAGENEIYRKSRNDPEQNEYNVKQAKWQNGEK